MLLWRGVKANVISRHKKSQIKDLLYTGLLIGHISVVPNDAVLGYVWRKNTKYFEFW